MTGCYGRTDNSNRLQIEPVFNELRADMICEMKSLHLVDV